MGRPFTNIKNYEKEMRKVKLNPFLKLSKLEIYDMMLKSIDKERKKVREKVDLLDKKRDVIVNLIFEEKDKFSILK